MTLDTNEPTQDDAEDAAAAGAETDETGVPASGPPAEPGPELPDRAQLIEQFTASPEAQALQADGQTLRWAGWMLDYAARDLDVAPTALTAENLREVVFRLFPRYAPAPADEAAAAIRELRAFWQFAERAYGLPNAPALLAVLDDKAARRLEIGMSNPANYDEEKAFTLGGQARGYDMTTDAGRDAWRQIYEAEQTTRNMMPFSGAGAGLPDVGGAELGDEDGGGPTPASGTHRKAPSKTQQKAKRKMAKASQRKNRKK